MAKIKEIEAIRINEIARPTSEPIKIIGKVTGIWGPNNIEKTSVIRCSNCGNGITLVNKFPYDKLTLPNYCLENEGGCGKYKSICKFKREVNAEGSNSATRFKIYLRDGTSHFILILLNENVPPNVGDIIAFDSIIKLKLGDNSPIIRSWTGESTQVTVAL